MTDLPDDPHSMYPPDPADEPYGPDPATFATEEPGAWEDEDQDDGVDLGELLTIVAGHGHSLAAIGNRLEAVIEELADWPPGGKWFWPDLNPDQGRELATELDGFVTWLNNRIVRYLDSRVYLKDCWFQHPAAVEMLTAVMVAHRAAYTKKSSRTSFHLSAWFTQSLLPMLEAMANHRIFSSCKGAHHDPEEFEIGAKFASNSPGFHQWSDATFGPANTTAKSATAAADPATPGVDVTTGIVSDNFVVEEDAR